MKRPKGVSLFNLTENRINWILDIWDNVWKCPNNCQVVADCNGSCKNK